MDLLKVYKSRTTASGPFIKSKRWPPKGMNDSNVHQSFLFH